MMHASRLCGEASAVAVEREAAGVGVAAVAELESRAPLVVASAIGSVLGLAPSAPLQPTTARARVSEQGFDNDTRPA
jgi:hypothetical protein